MNHQEHKPDDFEESLGGPEKESATIAKLLSNARHTAELLEFRLREKGVTGLTDDLCLALDDAEEEYRNGRSPVGHLLSAIEEAGDRRDFFRDLALIAPRFDALQEDLFRLTHRADAFTSSGRSDS